MSKTKKSQPVVNNSQWWALVIMLILLSLIIGFFFIMYRVLDFLWHAFKDLDTTVAAATIAGIFTLIATTITIMLGRYFEEKRKQAELHRERKIKMYDKFIKRIFQIFASENKDQVKEGSDSSTQDDELIKFLREHQRQFLLWSNAGVIRAYAEWQKTLTDVPSAQTVLKMEGFFLAVRKDLGHSNWGIKQGDTVRYLLRHTDFFLEQIKNDPNITLSEIARREEEAGLTTPQGS